MLRLGAGFKFIQISPSRFFSSFVADTRFARQAGNAHLCPKIFLTILAFSRAFCAAQSRIIERARPDLSSSASSVGFLRLLITALATSFFFAWRSSFSSSGSSSPAHPESVIEDRFQYLLFFWFRESRLRHEVLLQVNDPLKQRASPFLLQKFP